MRPMARLVLAVGLSVKQPEIAGLATDVLVAAIDDGRLDGENLGESLAIAWQLRIETSTHRSFDATIPFEPQSVPFVKPPRWAKALGDAARSSPLHAGVIARGARARAGRRDFSEQNDRERAAFARVDEGGVRSIWTSHFRAMPGTSWRARERGKNRARHRGAAGPG